MTTRIVPFVQGKYYVADIHGTPGHKVISGPFDTAEQAERDRLQINIDGDCLIVRATTSTTIETVYSEPTPEKLPTYASFWVYDSSSECHVKKLLNTADHTGEENAITESRGGQTEDGSHHHDELWYFDTDSQGRLVIVHEHHADATDCDGRFESHSVYECPIDQLDVGRPVCHFWLSSHRHSQAIPGLRYPAWEERRDGSYQRDHTAEAAGY